MHSSKNHVSIAEGPVQRGRSKRLCSHAQIKAKTAVEMQYLVHGQAADVFCCTGGRFAVRLVSLFKSIIFCSFGGGTRLKCASHDRKFLIKSDAKNRQ